MKIAWLIITVILLVFGVYSLVNSIYWIMIGYSTEYGAEFVFGSFILPFILLLASYGTWKKTRS